MQNIQELLTSYTVWNNTLWDYAISLVIFFGIVFVIKIFQSLILARLRKFAKFTSNDVDDAFIETISKISSWFYIIIPAYIGSKYILLSANLEKVLGFLFLVALVYEVIRAIEHLISFSLSKYIATSKKSEEYDPHSEAMIRIAVFIVRGILWGIALLLVLSNIGFDITSLIASLGIGGIAIALALQNVLTDIFSSFSIFIDKPFQVGDYIVVGEHSGTVKKIGLKSTRLHALRGEEIVISNKELTSARVQNLKKLKKRRELLKFTVTHKTTEGKLELIPGMLKELVTAVEHAEFGRCHFAAYSPTGLEFETVYHIDTADYDTYMDVKQNINLALLKSLKKAKIDIAYATQTLYMRNF